MSNLKDDHEKWMRLALAEAQRAERFGEVPVGAVIVKEGRLIAKGRNSVIGKSDPSAHAEIVALRNAAKKIKNYRLLGAIMYVTLEPCAMCAGALVQARVASVVFGAHDPKAGACGSAVKVIPHAKLNHRPTIVKGVLSGPCGHILQEFFRRKRYNSASS